MCTIALFVFYKSHPSKRFSHGDCGLFTSDSRREANAIKCNSITTCQNRLKMAGTYIVKIDFIISLLFTIAIREVYPVQYH